MISARTWRVARRYGVPPLLVGGALWRGRGYAVAELREDWCRVDFDLVCAGSETAAEPLSILVAAGGNAQVPCEAGGRC